MSKIVKIFILLWTLSFTVGLLCDYFYKHSPARVINYENFKTQIQKKEREADKNLKFIENKLVSEPIDSLIGSSFINKDISYYVFENNNLIFWSDNKLDVSNLSTENSNWEYRLLPNAHIISKCKQVGNRIFVATITIKNNYPYENKELINEFINDVNTDKSVQIAKGKTSDKYAILSTDGGYLFSLIEPQQPIYTESWSVAGFIAFSISFIILFLMYAMLPVMFNKKVFSLKLFTASAAAVGVIIGASLYFSFPSQLLANRLFTAFQYASNPFLSSISHLTIATAYLFATIYFFYFHVEIGNKKHIVKSILLNMTFVAFFALLYYLLTGLIYHSSIQLNILRFNDLSIVSIWIHFLILFWGISLTLLFFKTHKYSINTLNINKSIILDVVIMCVLCGICAVFFPDNAVRVTISLLTICVSYYLRYLFPSIKAIYVFISLWAFSFSLFFIVNSILATNDKKNNKYKILAQNISINGNSENDRIADILLEELDTQLKQDKKIGLLLGESDSLTAVNSYLNKIYFRGFWNKYDIRLNVAKPLSEIDNLYKEFIFNYGSKVKGTHFYSILANENNLSYVGKFLTTTPTNDSVFYYMEFYPRSQFKSYSFPNLLIPTSPDIQSQLNISIAKYEHSKLIYTSGKIDFPALSDWIPHNKDDFFTVIHNGRKHFVYSPANQSYIIITELELHDPLAYLLYFLYIFIAYLGLGSLIVWLYLLIKNNEDYHPGLTSKFQFAFILLLIVSFLSIFYVSVNFIQKKYQEEQISSLESKKNYIQKSLQDLYYWNQELTEKNIQDLNFDLQDLSYLYHTDIFVYNNHGILIGSSQPRIFNKNLISNRISPKPFFTQNANLNQYEHIGKLNYLTAYTDFYNGDFLQIGYIAVPLFFSQDEIRTEINSFISVIIHIYLIIIVLVVFVSLFIGKQLSAPLIVLESKLKEMRLGRRNEKVDYKLNDEIGQLVMQYNRTVDELEQSAKLLAKSERDLAWKSMARQVAHEINNPLTPMKLTIQQLQRTKQLNDERFDDYFNKSTIMLVEQIDNLSRIAGTFSDFARMPEAKFEHVDIASKLNSVVQLFKNNYDKIQINYLGSECNVFVYADPEQLVQVFNNLLKNAIQAIPSDRQGEISVNLMTTNENVCIDIADNGIGIETEAYDKLFAPNFTTKNNGMGLGLAITKNIIEITGGSITFKSSLNNGTTFYIIFPKA